MKVHPIVTLAMERAAIMRNADTRRAAFVAKQPAPRARRTDSVTRIKLITSGTLLPRHLQGEDLVQVQA